MHWRRMGAGYGVVLERGEEVIERLTAFAREQGIAAGSVTGIGAVAETELGFYELETRTYHRRSFPDDHELVNLTGNYSLVDGDVFLHAHVTLGDAEYRAFAGHLFRATVAVTGEFVVTPLDGEVRRARDEDVGLNLWDLGSG